MSHETEHRPGTRSEAPTPAETREAVFPDKKSALDRLGRKGQFIAGGAILATIIGGGIGAQKILGDSNESPVPTPKPTIDAPVTPGETATPTTTPAPTETVEPSPTDIPTGIETEVPLSDIEPVPADLPADELVKEMSERLEQWVFAGATEDSIAETQNKVLALMDEGHQYEDALDLVAQENAKKYEDTLLAENWEENPLTVDYRDGIIEENTNLMGVVLGQQTRGEEFIYREIEFSEFEEITDPTLVKEGQRLIHFVKSVTPRNSTSEPRKVLMAQVFDVSDGTARLVERASNNIS